MRSWLKCLRTLHILSDISHVSGGECEQGKWMQRRKLVVLTREETVGVEDSETMGLTGLWVLLGEQDSKFS